MELHSKAIWNMLGCDVIKGAVPIPICKGLNAYCREETIPIDGAAPSSPHDEMPEAMKARGVKLADLLESKLVIISDKSSAEIYDLAQLTGSKNETTEGSPLRWSNRVARYTIREVLTNYEQLCSECPRCVIGEAALIYFRRRVDARICETYPQFAFAARNVSAPW